MVVVKIWRPFNFCARGDCPLRTAMLLQLKEKKSEFVILKHHKKALKEFWASTNSKRFNWLSRNNTLWSCLVIGCGNMFPWSLYLQYFLRLTLLKCSVKIASKAFVQNYKFMNLLLHILFESVDGTYDFRCMTCNHASNLRNENLKQKKFKLNLIAHKTTTNQKNSDFFKTIFDI